jgi:hypothetical protein
LRLAAILAPALLVSGCSSEVATIHGCEASAGMVPICGFSNPEDLAPLPGGSWLVVSQISLRDGVPGSLVGFRVSDARRRRLYPVEPGGVNLSVAASAPGWGSPECPGPPDAASFAPHGVDVTAHGPSGAALAVVNHGGRESIEFFEIGYAAGGPALGWRGCVPMPPGTWPNDVAFLPDGGVVATSTMPPPGGWDALWAGLRLMLGADSGSLFAWRAEEGWSQLEGSRGSGPNGVAVSPDGSEIFFGEWGSGRLVRLRPDGEPRRFSVELPHHPDNFSWSRDGRLLVTGQIGRLGEFLDCMEIEGGACAIPFSVVAVEPATLEIEVLLRHDADAMGAASASVEVGGDLFIGAFAGDRIARVRLPRSPADPASR